MSNSTGSSPTTSRSVPHSSQDTISPLSVSKSTWTSASHSGQVPVGTFSSSPRYGEGRAIPPVGRGPLPCKQPNQSTRERWNLQQSFSLRLCAFAREIFVSASEVFLTQRRKVAKKSVWIPTPAATYQTPIPATLRQT